MPAWPAWLVMWTLAGAIYGACKLLTWRAADDAGHRATWWRHAGYLLAWPGMDAPAFFATTAVRQPALREWCAAAGQMAFGAGLVFAVVPAAGASRSVVTGWLGMLGLVLLLHFGAFHLLSCAWRFAGVDARPLMASPLRAASVAEFWGRRWNTAFRDLTHRFVFTPLRRWLGPAAAILAGFIGSGLVHDLVISAAGARRLRRPDGLLRGPGRRAAGGTQRRRTPAGPRPRHPRAALHRGGAPAPTPLAVSSPVRRARRRPVPPGPRCRMTNQTMAFLLTVAGCAQAGILIASSLVPATAALARGAAAAAPTAPADALGLRRLRRSSPSSPSRSSAC